MAKIIYLIGPVLVSATTTLLNLTMDNLGRWRMPTSARLVASGTEINARVILDVHGHHNFRFRPRQSDTFVRLDIADSLIIDDNINGRTVIQTGNFLVPNFTNPGMWNFSDASIGVSFGSSIAELFDRVIITPTSGERRSGLLILNPATPEQFAHEGRWVYVDSLNERIPIIQASVVVGNHSTASSQAANFGLTTTYDHSSIPQEAFENIVGYLERAGFNIVDSSDDSQSNPAASTDVWLMTIGNITTLTIHGSSASELAQVLPPIHFDMVSGPQRFRITIFPEDYIKAFNHGHSLTVLGVRDGGDRYCIGTNVLRRLAIQIDKGNHRIGFADPVNEI